VISKGATLGMAITDIKTEWVNAWDNGWGGEQWPLIMNLDGPADILAQITLVTYSPNDGGSYGQKATCRGISPMAIT
jgi:hypothetical protein